MQIPTFEVYVTKEGMRSPAQPLFGAHRRDWLGMLQKGWAEAPSKQEASSAGLQGVQAVEGAPAQRPLPRPCQLSFGLRPNSMFLTATLLLGLAVLGIRVWAIQMEFVDISKDLDYFVVSVEFAVAWFNSGNTEEQAYKLLEVRRAQQKVSGHHGPWLWNSSPQAGLGEPGSDGRVPHHTHS